MRLMKSKIKKIKKEETAANTAKRSRLSSGEWEASLKDYLQDSPDFTTRLVQNNGQTISIFYLTNLITSQQLDESILEVL